MALNVFTLRGCVRHGVPAGSFRPRVPAKSKKVMTVSPSKLLPLLAVLLLAAVACSSGPDRDTAVANLTRGDNALTDEQANCVVDTVGEDKLETYDNFSATYQEEFEAQTENPDADAAALLDAVLECAFPELGSALEDLEAGVEELGSELGGELADIEGAASEALGDAQAALDDLELPADDEPIDCSTVEGPCDYGDDPELDALWDGCQAGDGQACDDLYFDSPFGSRYEQFGNTCGDRGFELECAEVYSN